ncbi:MAG: NADH:flavin oxidoreductase [Candidatus Glassbacteria bacterium]|nr:NADH:flavin oxidoreductase [Candidatus Glassbacteria bacterium]
MPEATITSLDSAYQPFESERLKLPGRLVRAPVWSGTADEQGFVTDRTIEFYTRLAGKGLGLIETGFSFVSENSRAVPRMLGISNDDFIPGLTELVEAVHKEGDKIALQIAHCGLNADASYDPDGLIYGPSLIALNGSTQSEKSGRLHKGNAHIMRSLTRWQIDQIIDEFIEAAERAEEAGFDAVELHGAHHYLISEFLSPTFNKRTDIFGGGSRQRSRFAVDIVRGVREAMPELPILFRLNCEDFTPGGITLEDTRTTAEMLVEAGVDIISVSGNDPTRTRIVTRAKEAYFREQARVIRQACGKPVIVTGGIRSPEGVNEILENEFADLVGIGRPLIRTPDLPARWREGNFEPYECISCNSCMRSGMEYSVSCVRMGEEELEEEEI